MRRSGAAAQDAGWPRGERRKGRDCSATTARGAQRHTTAAERSRSRRQQTHTVKGKIH